MNENTLATNMRVERCTVSSFRNSLGEWSEGYDPVLLLSRGKPAGVFVPLPSSYGVSPYDDGEARYMTLILLERVQVARDESLPEEDRWRGTSGVAIRTMTEMRRETRSILTLLSRNTTVILTASSAEKMRAIIAPLPRTDWEGGDEDVLRIAQAVWGDAVN